MTTARKPPVSPKPKLTRAPAPTSEPRNPITRKIIGRIQKVITDSQGQITTSTIATEADLPRAKVYEWLGGWRSTPSGDNLIALIGWLVLHGEERFVRQVFRIPPGAIGAA